MVTSVTIEVIQAASAFLGLTVILISFKVQGFPEDIVSLVWVPIVYGSLSTVTLTVKTVPSAEGTVFAVFAPPSRAASVTAGVNLVLR